MTIHPSISRLLALLAFTLFLVFGQACRSKAPAAETANSQQADAELASDTIFAEAAPIPRDSLVLSLERTPCFGQCPVYRVKVYESGYATYEGINFVDRMGHFYTRLTDAEVQAIRSAAEAGGFFGFEEQYDLQGLQDLPDNILQISDGNQVHRVNARFEIPRRVQTFFEAMIKRLDGYNWRVQS